MTTIVLAVLMAALLTLACLPLAPDAPGRQDLPEGKESGLRPPHYAWPALDAEDPAHLDYRDDLPVEIPNWLDRACEAKGYEKVAKRR